MGSNRQGEGGAVGKYTGKMKHSKSKFDNVFDIRKSHGLCIHNVRKIHLLGFSVQRLWGKTLKISRSVSIGPLFSNYDWWVPMMWGLNPYFI